jgi:hypothetical protein
VQSVIPVIFSGMPRWSSFEDKKTTFGDIETSTIAELEQARR